MKVVIFAGGFGTRISEESRLKPKPMIEIGDYPILWHIMKIYSSHGFNDFIICLGYKSNQIKDYFSHYFVYESDVTYDYTKPDEVKFHTYSGESWKVTLVDTGRETMTGGRLKRVSKYIGNDPFMLTYGDGLADINIQKLLEFHQAHGKLATVTATQPNGRFGALHLTEDGKVAEFKEKPKGESEWINGGFFVMQPEVLNYIDGDHTVFEKEPLENLAKDGQLMAYKHSGFWHPMDTLRDKKYLEELWISGKAPWKLW